MTSEGLQRRRIASRKVLDLFEMADDSLEGWIDRYQTLAVEGVRSEEVSAKIGCILAGSGRSSSPLTKSGCWISMTIDHKKGRH